MRRIFLTLMLILASGLGAVRAQDTVQIPPEVPGEAVYIPFPVAITLDGKLDDWANIPVITVAKGQHPSDNPDENGPMTFAVASDATNFYITATIHDTTIITGQHDSNFWNEDSLEFYLNLSDDRYSQKYTDQIFQFNINPGDIGNTDPAKITVTGTNGTKAQLLAFVFKTDDGWGFEAQVPLGDFKVVHGREIGIQAQANGATELDRIVKLIWSNADTNDLSWSNPSLFGSGIFFELGQTDIPVPSVRPTELVAIATETPPMKPRISLNQVGYFSDSPKYAMFNGVSGQTATWELIDTESGRFVAYGTTTPATFDSASGDAVQIADFSQVTEAGTYILRIGDVDSDPFTIGTQLYDTLSQNALRYFYLNRSGIALDAQYAGDWARPAGHLSDNSLTCYKGTDVQGKTWDGCDYRLDVSHGWYDAGDYGKYVVNGGISVWTLLNAYEQHPSAFTDATNIPESGNGIADILDEVRWEMDFLLGMQVPADQPLAGMVHHKAHDVVWAGIPVLPATNVDNDNPQTGRFLMPPSTAATLNLAAVGAQCARVYAEIDPVFAQRCLDAAETAWDAATTQPVMLAGNTPGQGGGDYTDGDVQDETFWAATELYITTGKDVYLTAMNDSPYMNALYIGSTVPNGLMWWGKTNALGTISLLTVPNGLSDDVLSGLKAQMVAAADAYLSAMDAQGYRVTVRGDQFEWGSNSTILNNAIVFGLAYTFTGDARYRHGMIESMDWLLGRNALGVSFISGYGTYAMQHPHHRFWGNDSANGFPPPPPGAIAGGVNMSPADAPETDEPIKDVPPARRYLDNIASYSTNEVAINWNAPLVWVTSYLNK